MTDIVKLEDADGNVHYTARGSQRAEQLLRDGAADLDAPAEPRQEVTDAQPPAQGDDPDAGTIDGGSGDGKRTTRNAKRRDGSTSEA